MEKMDIFKYKMASTTILYSNGDKVEVNSNSINSLFIEKDFENAIFPIIKLEMVVTAEDKKRLITERTTTKIRLKFQKFIWDSETKEDGVLKTIFNDTFVYLDTKRIDINAKDKKIGDTGEKSIKSDINNVITLYLYNYKNLIASKHAINCVFESTNMNTANAYVLSESGFENILMEKSDNNDKYKNLLIPPMTSQGAIHYLHETYGTYKSGLIFFCDVDRTYLMSKGYKCTVFEKDEYKQTSFLVPISDSSDRYQSGTSVDKENSCYNINIKPTSISISNESAVNDQLTGNILEIIDVFKNKVSEVKAKTDQLGKGTKNFYIGEGFASDILKTQLSESNFLVQAAISDFDIDAVTPNKKFTISYKDKALNKVFGGNHRITREAFLFTKSGDNMLVTGQLTLRRDS